MKTYLFNVENGLYQGETFENADTIKYVEGITTVPPPHYERGQVPVFDPRRNEWNLMPVNVVRQQLDISSANSKESK